MHTRNAYTIALRDDFDFWRSCHESDDSGKLLLIDASINTVSESSSQDISIFFDDNIERERAHIVDVREASTFARIPFADANNRYVKRVEPMQAIMNMNYYIDAVDEILRKFY